MHRLDEHVAGPHSECYENGARLDKENTNRDDMGKGDRKKKSSEQEKLLLLQTRSPIVSRLVGPNARPHSKPTKVKLRLPVFQVQVVDGRVDTLACEVCEHPLHKDCLYLGMYLVIRSPATG